MSLISGNDRTRILFAGVSVVLRPLPPVVVAARGGRMAEKYNKHNPDPSETPPIDVMPAATGESMPPDPTPAQHKSMALQNEKIEELRRKFGMSRRQFVRTAAA